MTVIATSDVMATLSKVIDPSKNKDVVALDAIEGLAVSNGHVSFALRVAPTEGSAKEPLRLACEKAVLAMQGVRSVTAVLTAHRDQKTPPAQPERKGPAGVGAVIAVASGKGGVGKSTVAVNLAVALSRLGQRTGLLDADIYGPSIPRMLGLSGKPLSRDGKTLTPMEAWGLKAMSIGSLINEDQPMIWRGPMVMSALSQLLFDVDWSPLDILIVDMPPGTGDAQLTLVQRVALTGAIIVSTPQDIALIDARKGLAMFKRTHVPILGIIENMSTYICPNCGHEEHIFGHGGARETARTLDTAFLGEIPLNIDIRTTSDQGTPIVHHSPDAPQSKIFMSIAERVLASIIIPAARQAPALIME